MNVVGYTRVSTEEQEEVGKSLKTQAEKIEGYCKLYDLTLVEVVSDTGSGKNLKRPGLQKVLGMLSDGRVAGLVVGKLDRLTRSIRDWQWLIENAFGEKSGQQLFSVSDSIDTRTAAGRLVLNMLLSVAQWERETISERTKEALQYKISRGERCGKLRFGHDLAPDGAKLVPNEREQASLQLMRNMRGCGQSFRAIAREMNAMGILAKEGKPWQHTSVREVLRRAA